MLSTANGIDLHYRIDGTDDAPWVTFVTGINAGNRDAA